MNFNINMKNKKICTLLSVYIASALIFAPIVISNSAFAQSFTFDKDISRIKAAKCNSGALTSNACKNFANLGQANSGGISTGQTATGAGTATGAAGNGTGATTTGGSNIANSAISQSQQATQSCATGNLKLLPHSSITCSDTANLGQANSGGISTGQTVTGDGIAKP